MRHAIGLLVPAGAEARHTLGRALVRGYLDRVVHGLAHGRTANELRDAGRDRLGHPLYDRNRRLCGAHFVTPAGTGAGASHQ